MYNNVYICVDYIIKSVRTNTIKPLFYKAILNIIELCKTYYI